eukprot:TRINITY_DN71547_c0_g1_i1.p1 TRINITY_DN71547_c0_g1~~TRINITY_DN71547_c0_g1_i1.p1  ORF type:complete len:190 (+),score=31.29 TRINITY_DN71547_c0_g1_i1:2-571(+)
MRDRLALTSPTSPWAHRSLAEAIVLSDHAPPCAGFSPHLPPGLVRIDSPFRSAAPSRLSAQPPSTADSEGRGSGASAMAPLMHKGLSDRGMSRAGADEEPADGQNEPVHRRSAPAVVLAMPAVDDVEFLLAEDILQRIRAFGGESAVRFVGRCLTIEPSARPAAADLLSDPFLVEATRSHCEPAGGVNG